jgi:hypothetical protein
VLKKQHHTSPRFRAELESLDIQQKKRGLQSELDRQVEKEYALLTKGVTERGPKKKILSNERSDLLRSILRMDDPEWSSLWLAGGGLPSLGKCMDKHFIRYVYHPNPNLDDIRMHIARISLRIEQDAYFWRSLLRTIVSSLRALDRSRLEESAVAPRRFPLFNFFRLDETDAEMMSVESSEAGHTVSEEAHTASGLVLPQLIVIGKLAHLLRKLV